MPWKAMHDLETNSSLHQTYRNIISIQARDSSDVSVTRLLQVSAALMVCTTETLSPSWSAITDAPSCSRVLRAPGTLVDTGRFSTKLSHLWFTINLQLLFAGRNTDVCGFCARIFISRIFSTVQHNCRKSRVASDASVLLHISTISGQERSTPHRFVMWTWTISGTPLTTPILIHPTPTTLTLSTTTHTDTCPSDFSARTTCPTCTLIVTRPAGKRVNWRNSVFELHVHRTWNETHALCRQGTMVRNTDMHNDPGRMDGITVSTLNITHLCPWFVQRNNKSHT